ncbi:MAG: hypothetical protein Q8J68_07925 [Methanolobus sp.]|uniref:hypothetical protein n=1 Tax=Methanolobus sp. TaxID=1874737 RepID=UPI00272F5E1C|nr:hypothetical protein [Methanolobus sp.]MDP2217196.1 hypothetical protein [Methanolobus sp.]
MNIRNRELKTIAKVISSGVANLTIGGQVPSSIKRWVTFLLMDSITVSRASDIGFYFASVGVSNPTIGSTVLAANRKLYIPIEATQLNNKKTNKKHPVMIPESGPDPDNPLFSIASGKWLSVVATKTTGHVFMQYFDE